MKITIAAALSVLLTYHLATSTRIKSTYQVSINDVFRASNRKSRQQDHSKRRLLQLKKGTQHPVHTIGVKQETSTVEPINTMVILPPPAIYNLIHQTAIKNHVHHYLRDETPQKIRMLPLHDDERAIWVYYGECTKTTPPKD